MAFEDLYADASLYLSLNNTMSYTLASGEQNGTTGTVAPVFVSDAPANTGSTHSLRLSGYSTSAGSLQTPIFRNMTDQGQGRTVTFWYKTTKADGTAQILGDSLGNTPTILSWTPAGGTAETIFLSGGTYSNSRNATDGKITGTLRDINTSTSTETVTSMTITHNTRIIPGIWNHVAYVDTNVGTTVYRAVYINGACAFYVATSSRTSRPGFGVGDGSLIILGSTANSDVAPKYIAHYAVWQKALTKDEIRAQAFYGLQTTQSYEDYIVSENPVYFTTLNNANKTTDPQVLGSAGSTWGPLADDAANILVGQEGYPTGAGWGLTVGANAADNYSDTTTAGMRQGFSQLQATGEYTFECWMKFNKTYVAGAQPLLSFQSTVTSGTALNEGFLVLRNNGFGRVQFILPNRTGTSTFAQSNQPSSSYVLHVGPGVTDIAPGTYGEATPGGAQDSGNFTDGRWHHIVLRQSNTKNITGTANQFAVQVFVDGCQISSAALTNTSGWITPSTFIEYIRTGTSGTLANSSLSLIDNIALYGRSLSDAEIMQHFVAGYNYIQAAPATPVRYWDGSAWVDSSAQKVWNGTAWIDWTKSYWDGTQWVSI